jgi:hypothetical protein
MVVFSQRAGGRGPDRSEGEQAGAEEVDAVAAVVLHILVAAAPATLTLEEIINADERDTADARDRALIQRALGGLLVDGLAQEHEGKFAPTRAAIRGAELSF